MTDVTGNNYSSREKTTQWLEDVLTTYYTYLEKQERPPEGEKKDVLNISVIDFDIGPGLSGDGRLSTLSDLLSLKVLYRFAGSDEDKTENLIVKIPPNDRADREMAQLAQVDKREIHFYTEAAIDMEEWIKSRKADIKLSIPKCYFAKYHAQPVQGDDGDNLSDAESVLVLQDLRPLGFSMRDFNSGLTLDEAKAALKQIAIIHATSWAFQESTGEPLDEKWEFAYRPRKAASAYKMMIEQGFPTLADFLERQQPDGSYLLTKLKALHPNAADLLCELLVPPSPPNPSCLTHMDFWCNNLLFRKRTAPDGSNDNEPSNEGSKTTPEMETECQILDWQMMAIGRPTHDVALLLFTSLTPEIRHSHMEDLLKHYWSIFQETTQKLGLGLPFDFDCIKEEYKKSQLLALLLVVGNIDLAIDSAPTEARLMEALRDMAKDELI